MKFNVRKKRHCPECNHRHEDQVICHVYMSIDEQEEFETGNFTTYELPNGDVINHKEDESDDGDDMNIGQDIQSLTNALASIIKKEKSRHEIPQQPLTNPYFLRNIKYKRCNCDVGVPNNNKAYEPITGAFKVGGIKVLTYFDILDEKRKRKEAFIDVKAENENLIEERKLLINESSKLLPLILQYLQINQCSQVPQVCKSWNEGTRLYQDYIDLRDCFPYFSYRLHQKSVEGVLLHDNKLFSAGDRRIIASDVETGKSLAVIMRTTGEISCLTVFKDLLFFGDLNGSIKSSIICHNPSQMVLNKTQWEHSRSITEVLFGSPSNGHCEMHGLLNHVCVMYSCSEDRAIRVWNMSDFECIQTVDTKTLRFSTFTCMSQSDRHLFAGTSASRIAVFSKFNHCDRDDIHFCSTFGVDKSYCLQVTLMLPFQQMPSGNLTSVTKVLCTGPNYSLSHLWASDSSGKIIVWEIPENGINFLPKKTWLVNYTIIHLKFCLKILIIIGKVMMGHFVV